MTINELARQIEQRVDAAREGIARLQNARDALTAVAAPRAAPRSGRRAERSPSPAAARG
jgi:hypothetical protein